MMRSTTMDGEQASAAGFEAFFREHRRKLFSALLITTRDRALAEDVLQVAFTKVWERWPRVRAMEDPTGYLFRIAFNELRQLGRRRRPPESAGRPEDDPLTVVERNDTLRVALLRLPRRERAALVLTEMLEYESREAGRILGVRAGTVRMLCSRGRARLRALMEEERS